MKNIDDLLDAVRSKTDWQSDYQIGKGLGYKNTAQVSGWRRRVAMPNNRDLIAMCDKASIDLGEAVRAVEYSRENERPMKQAGYASIGMMGTLGTISAMTLLATSAIPSQALFGAALGAKLCILC